MHQYQYLYHTDTGLGVQIPKLIQLITIPIHDFTDTDTEFGFTKKNYDKIEKVPNIVEYSAKILSKPQLNHNSTQPNITLSCVRHENDFAH